MKEITDKYVAAFKACLDANTAYTNLVAACGDSGNEKLANHAIRFGDTVLPEDEAIELKLAFIREDGDIKEFISRMNSQWIAAFDAFGTAEAAKLKEAAQCLLECQYTLLLAHKQRVYSPRATEIEAHLDASEEFNDCLCRDDGEELERDLWDEVEWDQVFPNGRKPLDPHSTGSVN